MNELILQVCNTRFVKISEGLFLSNISKIDYTIVLEELRMNSQMRCHHNYYYDVKSIILSWIGPTISCKDNVIK